MTDGTALPKPDPVNAITQIELFTAALPASAGQTDDVRSYDLVWLLHLVGDVHQPLHSIALFNSELSLQHQLAAQPDVGDRGGNEIEVNTAKGETMALHAYWDGMFGGYSTVDGAIFPFLHCEEGFWSGENDTKAAAASRRTCICFVSRELA